MVDTALVNDLKSCGSPETLLAAILKHRPERQTPVDVEAFARDVGIREFRTIDGDGATCALMADIGKTEGVILCAPGLSPQRQRFAIAHQLGHYLLASHLGDRQCSDQDLGERRRDTAHRKAEMQANRFAAGLLMPKPWFVDLVASLGKATVAHIPTIAAGYAVSVETAAARYADLTQTTCAFLFIKNGVMRYARPSRSFPPLSITAGDEVVPAVRSARPDDRIAWIAADPRDWMALATGARPPRLAMQILSKSNGFQLVMLLINAAAERRADEEAEKAATESPKFGRRPSR